MNVPRTALAVLLGATLLATVVLRERLDGKELPAVAPAKKTSRPPRPSEPDSGDPVPRPAMHPPENSERPDSRRASGSSGDLKHQLARLFQLFSDPGATTVEAGDEIGERIIAFNQIILRRGDDPAAYSELLQTILEVSLSGSGLALTRDQSDRLSAVLRDAGAEFPRAAELPPCDQLAAGLRAEAACLKAARDCLSDPQWRAVSRSPLLELFVARPSEPQGIPADGAAESLAAAWFQAYDLDPEQQRVASEAANDFVRTLSTFRESAAGPVSLEGYGLRISALEAQAAALDRIASSFTSEQRERLLATPLREILILNDASPPDSPR